MSRRVPAPNAEGVRRYGYRNQYVENKSLCVVEVRGFHSSHQCTNPRKPGTERCGIHAEAPDERITMFFVGIGHWRTPETGGIKTVEVAKLTNARVQLPSGTWDKLASRSGRYFMDRDAAVAHVRERLVQDVESHKRGLAAAEAALAKFNKIYPEG